MLPQSQNTWEPHPIMLLKKLLQQIPHFQSFFHIVILKKLTDQSLANWHDTWPFNHVPFSCEHHTWFISIACKPSPRVKIMAWFWFSGLPSPKIAGPGSFILYITWVRWSHRKYELKWYTYKQSKRMNTNSCLCIKQIVYSTLTI